MWCVAELDEKYMVQMEDVLEVYEKPYDPKQPVVCLDEKPIALHADVRPASPAAPGREARRDNEYKRCGTANVFCAVEPKAGRHFTFPTPDRSAPELAQVLFHLAFQYPEAETIHLVMDNLNIHHPQVPDGLLRSRSRRRDLGLLHRPLHSETRELAQPSRNRNRDVLPAMLWEPKNSRSGDASPGEPGLDSPCQSCSRQNQLEIQSPGGPAQVWLQKNSFKRSKT